MWFWEAGVYPRVCGGAPSAIHQPHPVTGLSPRVRGSLDVRELPAFRPGSIPACAGEPQSMQSLTPHLPGSIPACAGEPHGCHRFQIRPRVYPRVCGGAPASTAAGSSDTGLSPRVRGSRVLLFRPAVDHGSIPACAGEPRMSKQSKHERMVYPRVCGGAARALVSSTDTRGLSPRVRGSPPSARGASPLPGSIPACAGGAVGLSG